MLNTVASILLSILCLTGATYCLFVAIKLKDKWQRVGSAVFAVAWLLFAYGNFHPQDLPWSRPTGFLLSLTALAFLIGGMWQQLPLVYKLVVVVMSCVVVIQIHDPVYELNRPVVRWAHPIRGYVYSALVYDPDHRFYSKLRVAIFSVLLHLCWTRFLIQGETKSRS